MRTHEFNHFGNTNLSNNSLDDIIGLAVRNNNFKLFNFLTNQYFLSLCILCLLLLFNYIRKSLPLTKLKVFKFISIVSICALSIACLIQIFLIDLEVNSLYDLFGTKGFTQISLSSLFVVIMVVMLIEESTSRLRVYISTFIGKAIIVALTVYFSALPYERKVAEFCNSYIYPCLVYSIVGELSIFFMKTHILSEVSNVIEMNTIPFIENPGEN